jgi:hypothetical protein
VSTPGPEQPDKGIPPDSQESEVQTGQDKAVKTVKAPSEGLLAAFSAAAKEIWPGWWFIMAGVILSCMTAIIVTRVKSRHQAE